MPRDLAKASAVAWASGYVAGARSWPELVQPVKVGKATRAHWVAGMQAGLHDAWGRAGGSMVPAVCPECTDGVPSTEDATGAWYIVPPVGVSTDAWPGLAPVCICPAGHRVTVHVMHRDDGGLWLHTEAGQCAAVCTDPMPCPTCSSPVWAAVRAWRAVTWAGQAVTEDGTRCPAPGLHTLCDRGHASVATVRMLGSTLLVGPVALRATEAEHIGW